MNPLTLLDSLLEDWVSAKVRRSIHTLLALGLALLALWQAAEGNWQAFLISLVGAGYSATNRANTTPLDAQYPSFVFNDGERNEYVDDADDADEV